ncbi:hypothetical protein QEH59_06485 [Coraliomargarita sp. SDUM461004]|uniref:Uncharacterized protein n=1 Tax=Thalassobacterium sedimentorum TaxID=3041258 RepID=A0ABU1AKD8_9BACT|nr:hypothetical protein [Coraliomargarita sp. SDUM461004]MDQ8194063.1 hypothetical protein [Coraliomargarita sp. SDUM461004]
MNDTESKHLSKTHQCPNFPAQGVSLYLDDCSTLLREFPTWHLEIQREATQADLEANHHLEEVGEALWTTMLEVSHCPYCGLELPQHWEQRPEDLGRLMHFDQSGWHSRKM